VGSAHQSATSLQVQSDLLLEAEIISIFYTMMAIHLVPEKNSHLFHTAGKLTSNGESEEPVSHRTENVYHMEAKLKEEGDYILEIMATGTLESHFPRGTWMEELSPIVKDLCNHTAMKATLQRQAEIPALSHFACYFLDKVLSNIWLQLYISNANSFVCNLLFTTMKHR
jgi:hypothetical protein